MFGSVAIDKSPLLNDTKPLRGQGLRDNRLKGIAGPLDSCDELIF
jgi:hypothetical protein